MENTEAERLAALERESRRVRRIAVAALAVAGSLVLMAQVPAARKVVSSAVGPSGRFVIVNPTPDLARNIMLLDSTTGDSWRVCVAADGVSQWCQVPRTDHPVSANGNE